MVLRIMRRPILIYVLALTASPILFAAGMLLFYSERVLGEPLKVQGGGAVALAANLSITGVTAVVRVIVSLGPHALVLIGLALPVLGTLFTIDRIDSRRSFVSQRRRTLIWSLACAETFVLLGLFIAALEIWPV